MKKIEKPRKVTCPRTYLVTVHIPRKVLESIDQMIEEGVFPSRSEAIRFALLYMICTFSRDVKETEKLVQRSARYTYSRMMLGIR